MRVANFPLAFAIATVVIILLIAIVIIANRMLKVSRLFEHFGT
jgi:hypothetical protein